MSSKTLEQRKAYAVHKSKQLDRITDAYRYARRAQRLMHYNNLLMEINNKKISDILNK